MILIQNSGNYKKNVICISMGRYLKLGAINGSKLENKRGVKLYPIAFHTQALTRYHYNTSIV